MEQVDEKIHSSAQSCGLQWIGGEEEWQKNRKFSWDAENEDFHGSAENYRHWYLERMEQDRDSKRERREAGPHERDIEGGSNK